jgi:hypothetical protein
VSLVPLHLCNPVVRGLASHHPAPTLVDQHDRSGACTFMPRLGFETLAPAILFGAGSMSVTLKGTGFIAFSGHLLQTVTRRGVPKLPGRVAVFPGAAGTVPLAWVPNGPLTSFRQLTAPS